MNLRKLVTLVFYTLLLGACNTPQPKPTDLEPQANYWQQLGTVLDVNLTQNAWYPSLALDSSGNPVVSWREGTPLSGHIYVKRWNGSRWVQLGTTFLDVTTNGDAYNPSLALDSSGNPVVSWSEWDGTSESIYVKRWNGSSWIQLGTYANSYQRARGPSLALDASGNPVVSWYEYDGSVNNIYVQRFNGTNWINVGTGVLSGSSALFSDAYNPSLALDSSGNPVVSWYEWDGTSDNIYVKRWTGTSWVQVGGILDANTNQYAYNPSLALDASGNPVVSWQEDDGTGTSWDIYVKRWNGSSWVALGGALDEVSAREALRPALDLRTDNNPVVTWQEWNGVSYDVLAKRWNGSAWVLIGGKLDKNPSQSARRPAIVLKSDNNPIISWDEWDGVSENILVKQF